VKGFLRVFYLLVLSLSMIPASNSGFICFVEEGQTTIRMVVGYTDESDLGLVVDAGGEVTHTLTQLRAVACNLPVELRINSRVHAKN